jgi:putative PIN family toxin of toxin-antitoxin system
VRVVLDTNIFVSGLLSAAGPPARIVRAVLQRRLIPIMSPATFAELNTVVHRPKLQQAFARAGVNLTIFLATVRAEAQFVAPTPPIPSCAMSVIGRFSI